jgi:branched-chain amino acid transport system ATP-binding protein
MEIIMENCERILVMHQGDILADGTPEEIKANETVVEAYLGGEIE